MSVSTACARIERTFHEGAQPVLRSEEELSTAFDVLLADFQRVTEDGRVSARFHAICWLSGDPSDRWDDVDVESMGDL